MLIGSFSGAGDAGQTVPLSQVISDVKAGNVKEMVAE